jgi:hypothetical protein
MSDLGRIHKDVDPVAAMMGVSSGTLWMCTQSIRVLFVAPWADRVKEICLDMVSTMAARGHDPGLQQQLCAKNIRRGRRVRPYAYISSVLGCQRDNRSRQRILISPDDRGVALGPARLTDDPAGLALRETILPSNALYCLPVPFGAYKFPEATSLSTCFSSDRSATRRLRRTFSRSRSFIRFA